MTANCVSLKMKAGLENNSYHLGQGQTSRYANIL